MFMIYLQVFATSNIILIFILIFNHQRWAFLCANRKINCFDFNNFLFSTDLVESFLRIFWFSFKRFFIERVFFYPHSLLRLITFVKLISQYCPEKKKCMNVSNGTCIWFIYVCQQLRVRLPIDYELCSYDAQISISHIMWLTWCESLGTFS